MARIEKTVFISYRRADEVWGLAIFQDLSQHGYDVFIDYEGIASGKFETVILENIRARAHFLVLLTPTALERCGDPKDWMRREIEAALDSRRNIVPLMLPGFDFGKPAIASQLTGKLAELKEYNGLDIPKALFFRPEMERLRNKFLNVQVDAVLHPASDSAQQVAKEQKGKAAKALADDRRKGEDEQPRNAAQATAARQAREEERKREEEANARRNAEEEPHQREAEEKRPTDYDFISAFVVRTEHEVEEIVYTVNSKHVPTEVRLHPTQLPLIRNLVWEASNNSNADTQIGRTLFSLLVPFDLEPFMGSSTETVLELDDVTAAIPWEVLEPPTATNRDKPWSIRTKLLRKLRAVAPTVTVTRTTAEDSILVIGDPACDRSQYPRLMGARQEAADVAACLAVPTSQSHESQPLPGPRVTCLIGGSNRDDVEPGAIAVINAVMKEPWGIIHIAGHGEPPVTIGQRTEPRGVVLSGGSFLGPREISATRVKPELVFVNCCHLATDDPNRLLKTIYYDRAQFASGVAHALIKGGVRCVIAAGWAVDDNTASVFAKAFYTALLGGVRFIDAVAAARESAYARGGNTWAAYQCYGDPDWRRQPPSPGSHEHCF